MADEGECSLSSEKNALLQNQKREKRELQARTQELKSAIPKGDKKRKKEAAAEIARLEQELEKKHSEERLKLERDQNPSESQNVPNGTELASNLTNSLQLDSEDLLPKERSRVSKAQKRREKKAAAASDREARIAEQEIENLKGERHLEEVTIKTLLHKRGLDIHQIPSDGNCLYQAVAHQLNINKDIQSECTSVPDIRVLAANEMRKNMDSYLPFLTNPQSGEPLTSEEYETYCTDLEKTNAWGGQIELRSLSEALKMPIEVVQAEGPPIILGEEFSGERKPLILSYHRHAYGLGEHYNSVVPKALDGCLDGTEQDFIDAH